MILDKPLAVFGEVLHEGDFLKEGLVLVVVFDLDLLEGVVVVVDGGGVDVGVAVAEFFFDLDLVEAVVALDQRVIGPKIKHILSLLHGHRPRNNFMRKHNNTTTNISQYLNPNQQVSSQMHTYSKYHAPNPHSRHTPDWYLKYRNAQD